MRLRQRGQKNKEDLYRASFGTNKIDNQVVVNMPPETNFVPTPSATNKTLLSRLNPFKKRILSQDSKRHSLAGDMFTIPHSYLEATANGRDSKTLPQKYIQATQRGRASLFSLQPQQQDESELLETTTIADLIRAIELIHTTNVNAGGSKGGSDGGTLPRRKMGTASLTPPKVPSLLTLFPQNYEKSSAILAQPQFDRRRSSLRPTIYNSIRHQKPNMGRRQSSAVIMSSFSSPNNSATPILRSYDQPPPYSIDSPKPLKRRFSVRPSNLTIPPGQAPPPSSTSIIGTTPSVQQPSTLQRRLSVRPSPLARQQSSDGAAARALLYRPAQFQRSAVIASQSRHASLSNLYENKINEIDKHRDRTDSK